MVLFRLGLCGFKCNTSFYYYYYHYFHTISSNSVAVQNKTDSVWLNVERSPEFKEIVHILPIS